MQNIVPYDPPTQKAEGGEGPRARAEPHNMAPGDVRKRRMKGRSCALEPRQGEGRGDRVKTVVGRAKGWAHCRQKTQILRVPPNRVGDV